VKQNGQKQLPATGAVVAIQAEALTQQEIESAILQTLALGRKAAVDELEIIRALHSTLSDPIVTLWAIAFTEAHQITWERRQLFGDLLFLLVTETN